MLAHWLGETAAARAYTVEGLALAEARQDEQAVSSFLFRAAALAMIGGDLAAAQAAAERALALARRIESIGGQGSALMQLGTVAHLRGDGAGAAAGGALWALEALALPEWTNRQWMLRNLGYLALDAGRPEEAAPRFREALEQTWSRRLESDVLENVNAYAALARERGQWERAARLLGAADAGLERLGGVLPEPIGRQARERTLATARGQLGEPAFAAAYAVGRALSLAQAVAVALAEQP